MGEYFEIDPVLIRLIFVLLAVPGGVGLLVYILSWIIIPEDPACTTGKSATEEIKEKADEFAKDVKKTADHYSRNREDGRAIAGIIIIGIGIIFLLQNILGWDVWENLWPLILVIIGLVIIANGRRSEKGGK